MTHRWNALTLAALIATLGCAGGQSGGELGGDGEGTTDGGSCEETAKPLALDEASAIGVTAEQILAFAEGTHEATLTYLPDSWSATAVALTPEGESTTVTVVIEAQGTAAFIDSEPVERRADGGPMIAMDLGTPCQDYVAIDVSVRLTTADGALDETLDGKLVAYGESQAKLSLPLELDALGGSFAVEVLEPEGGETVQTSVDVTFGTGVFVGDFGGVIELIDGDATQAGLVTYGSWGYGACESGMVPAQGALEAGAVLDLLNEYTPLTVTWAEGATTELNLAATADGPVCVELADPVLDVEGGRYTLAAELSLDTEDGRLATARPVSVTIEASDGEITELGVSFATLDFTTPQTFASTYGLSGVELGDHTDISLLLDLGYTVNEGEAVVEGELRVVGIPPTDCVDTENSACGSRGQQPIERAPISGP